MKWVGHVERMGEEKLADVKCPDSGGVKEARKIEKDFIKRDLERVGEDWRTGANSRRNW